MASSVGSTLATMHNSNKRLVEKIPPLTLPCTKRLYILRHGETDWNKKGLIQGGGYDIPLNDVGRTQAESVAEELKSIPLGVVASSHLARAKETADIVFASQSAKSSNADRLVMKGFGEMRFGDFEGMAYHGSEATKENQDRFKLLNQQLAQNPQHCYPGGGENVDMVVHRARSDLDAILEQYPDVQHISIVAHGRTNKVLLSSLIYDSPSEFNKIQQGNTCINVLDYDPTSSENPWKSVILNYVDHVDVHERYRN